MMGLLLIMGTRGNRGNRGNNDVQNAPILVQNAPILVQNVVTYDVVLEVDNEDHALYPGMTALVQVYVEEAEDVLAVPNSALRFRPAVEGGTAQAASLPPVSGSKGAPATLWVLEAASRPRAIPVTIGASNDSLTAVSGPDLKPGLTVVTGYRTAHVEAREP